MVHIFRAFHPSAQYWVTFTVEQVLTIEGFKTYRELCSKGTSFFFNTGCPDSEGAFIFCGDIIAWQKEDEEEGPFETIHEVFYQNGSFGIEYGNFFFCLSDLDSAEIRIIGNTTQNPELITKK